MARYVKGTHVIDPQLQAFCAAQRTRIRKRLNLVVQRHVKVVAALDPPPFEWHTRGVPQTHDSRTMLFKGRAE